MTVVFILCLAWRIDGVCLSAAGVQMHADRWSDAPCAALVAPRLRPNLIACHKTREVMG